MWDDRGDTLRSAREAFLSGDAVPAGVVRDDILKSWRRSASVGAAPDVSELPHWHDLAGGRLCQVAVPVLERFSRQLDTTATTLILADAQSRIMRRWEGDPSLGKALDGCEAVPGASLAEDYCGTNGIGSAVAERRAVRVAGGEHWADRFLGFSCVGAPLIHPVSRQLEGVVTLACRYSDTNNLMLPLVLNITSAIETRLYDDNTQRERLLLDAYLSASRRSRRPVVVLNERVIMTNAAASRLLDRSDHALLWQQAIESVSGRQQRTTEVVLASGAVVLSTCRTVRDGDQMIGFALELVCTASQRGEEAAHADSPHKAPPLTAFSQLIGRSRAWRCVLQEAVRHQRSAVPILISGEAGVGKLTLAAAMFGAGDAGSLTVIDAAMEPVEGLAAWLRGVERCLADPVGKVVVRHLELLDRAADHALCTVLDGVAEGSTCRIAATITVDPSRSDRVGPAVLERFGGARIEIPPLRDRPDDVRELADAFLTCHGGGRLTWTTEALGALLRGHWAGNVRQLETVINGLVIDRPSGEVRVEDLPVELRAAPRVQLGRLEKLEMNAIATALTQCQGNKSDAAALLGISRSTIYRKIRAFGLDLDRSVL